MSDEESITKPTDTRIGRVVPQFKIVMAIRCNLCDGVLYANTNDVDSDKTVGALQACVDTWKQSGSTSHRCRKGK
jgi:hypothetical protein